MSEATGGAPLGPAFARAEAAYRQLRQLYEGGSLSDEQFDEAMRAQTIDFGGRFWMIGVQSGEWYVSEGDAWKAAQPPRLPTPPPAAEPSPGRNESQPVVTTKPRASGGIDWAIMGAAFLIAILCFLYLSRRWF